LIPDLIHFVWLGHNLPLFGRFAVASARRHNPGTKIWFWHSHAFDYDTNFMHVIRNEDVIPKRLEISELFTDRCWVDCGLDLKTLEVMLLEAGDFVARSNIARALILYRYGGIYLDVDTLVVQSFDSLRQHWAFMGREHIVWPGFQVNSDSLYEQIVGPVCSAVRLFCARIPHGYLIFQILNRFYYKEANSAVWGALPKHPIIHYVLGYTCNVRESEWSTPHRLGTHVLQRAVRDYVQYHSDLNLLSPEAFYPLGPVISRHYFHRYTNLVRICDHVLSPSTYVLHWYASANNLNSIDEQELRSLKDTIFGYLCVDYL